MTDKALEIRKVIWTELSDFYLDIELNDDDLRRKADVFRSSGLTLDEIKSINYYEVGPQLINNLRSVAGVWAGFDQEWLHGNLQRLPKKEGRPSNFHKKNIDYYTSRYFKVVEKYTTE